MIFKGLRIENSDGIHLRSAQVLSKAMRGFSSDIKISTGRGAVNGKSVINLMLAGIKSGDIITVICSGEDEKEMLSAAEDIITGGFKQ